ncbi:hypothetical protein ACHAWC_004382 [Mediolabrus comicus]
MTSIETNNNTTKLLDVVDKQHPSSLSQSMSTMPPPASSKVKAARRVPFKKRVIKLPLTKKPRKLLKKQGSSDLTPKHRSYRNYSHLERVKFCLFLKILIHHLSMKDQDVSEQAKVVILECIKSQREGKLQDTPLMSALKGRLFGLVGKKEWEFCEALLQRYLVYHNIVIEL